MNPRHQLLHCLVCAGALAAHGSIAHADERARGIAHAAEVERDAHRHEHHDHHADA